MHFKSLELYGFKSFAGKTKINFEPGITAIVGPNGCGKSNCVDALKWVLGEQSAKDLRGTNMEDVIFNGTDTQDPVGFAEVSLVMSNKSKFLPIEYDEVVITRRLFRSGESEYLLNKNQVRLKDILELFMGTGVGTSAYSVIEQGKIDMIISSRPEDRRYIFEEASGIIKYKSKKKEAIRKLEYTENNLLRINDIIEEVRRQIGSIERQARKAERYKEEFERLKQLDTKAAFWEFKKLAINKEQAELRINGGKENESRFLKDIAQLNAKLADLKTRQAEIAAKLSEAQFKEFDLNSNIERSRDKINLDEERHKELEALKQSLLNEQGALEKTICELEETVSALSKEAETLSSNRGQKENLLSQKENRLKGLEGSLKQKEQDIRDGKLKTVDVLSRHSKTRNDLARILSDLANFQARERRLRLEKEEVAKELKGIGDAFSQIETEVDNLGKKISGDNQAKASWEVELNQKDTQVSGLDKRIQGLESSGLSLESRLTLLVDMIKSYEGFGSGPRDILTERQKNQLNIPGVYGAVAELINVKKGYEAAVEAALGGFLECIVVENKNAALALISYLKNKKAGKATIVALDSISPAKEGASISLPQDNVLGALADFVETDAKFKGLVSALFYNVYLVKDLREALVGLDIGLAGDAMFVALSGEVFRNGFLTGGTTKENADAGILNRKLQVQEIEAQLRRIRQEAAALKSTRENLAKEASELFEKINSRAEIIRQDELILANKRSQKDTTANSLKRIDDEASLLDLELKEIQEEIDSLKTRQVSSEAEVKCLDEENSAIQNLISGSQSFIETALKEREGLLIEITKMRTELSAVSEQEKNFFANLNMRSKFLTSQKQLLSEKQRTFNEAAARQEELKAEISGLQAAASRGLEEKEKVSLEFIDIKNKKLELEDLINQAEGEFEGKEAELNALKEALHNSQMTLQETLFKMEALKTRIGQAYKVELEQISLEIEEGIDWTALNNEIQELQQKIEKMGPVNLVAIEEHQELKERFDFLTKQKEDLANAKESLLEAIKKINKTTRELFMDTFQKVRVEFKEYFRFLFGGGQAELVLMDEQDILECGIEIMARPPGKKLQSISLLSGGEKALTAIALLFSIFKVKPSPFCILDEVDAPLDESNIGRFSKLLSEFTKTSQFIIITHNKKTISMADVMYGITMAQSGVSKVVSVRFAKQGQKEEVSAT